MNTPTPNFEKRIRTYINTCAAEDARNAHKQYLAYQNKRRNRLAGAKHAFFSTTESLKVVDAFARRWSIITGASELYVAREFARWMRSMATHYTHYWTERFNTDDWVLDQCAEDLAKTLESWFDSSIEGTGLFKTLNVSETPLKQ